MIANRQQFERLEDRYDHLRAEREEALRDQAYERRVAEREAAESDCVVDDQDDVADEDGTWENWESDTEDMDG